MCLCLPSEAKYEDVQTHGIYADFSLGARVYQDVEEALKEFEIGILGTTLKLGRSMRWSLNYNHGFFMARACSAGVKGLVLLSIYSASSFDNNMF